MADAGLIFFSAIVAAISYTYFISSRISKGIYRFISLLPIFFLFTILPLLLSSPIATFVAAFFITWLANSKLLLFAFNLGPLSLPKSLIQFITIASFPVPIKKPQFRNSRKKSHLNFWIQSFVFPFLINFTYNHRHELNQNVLLIIHSIIIFILVDFLVLASNAIVSVVLGIGFGFGFGLELELPSDEPYLSTSIQDFWGRRWNLTITNTLRYTVYKPVKSVFPAKDWARVPAVMAAFIVSGLMHELALYYLTRVSPTWEMTWFFVLHGMCLIVEVKVKRAVAGKFELPTVMAWLLTMAFMLFTSSWLLFPPIIKNGTDVKILEDLKLFIDYIKPYVID